VIPYLALPSSAAAGAVYLALAGVAVVVGLLVSVRVWPWTWCWRCRGARRLYSPGGRAWRDCPRCGGTGIRPRSGQR
jgi:hypothetical protein